MGIYLPSSPQRLARQAPRWPYVVNASRFNAHVAWTWANVPRPEGIVSYATDPGFALTAAAKDISILPDRAHGTGAYLSGSSSRYLHSGEPAASLVELPKWSREYIFTLPVEPASSARAIHIVKESPDSTTRDRSLSLDTGNKFRGYIYDGGLKYAISTTSAVANRSYHVALTAEAFGLLRIFVNGVEEHSVSIGADGGYAGYTTPQHVFGWGGYLAWNEVGCAVMSLCREYPYILTAAQISHLYENPWQEYEEYGRRTYFIPSAAGGTAYTAAFTSDSYIYTSNAFARLNEYNGDLTSDTYAYTPNALTQAIGYIAQLTSDTYAYTANAVTRLNEYVGALTADSYAYTANAVTRLNEYVGELTSDTYAYTSNALAQSIGLIMELTSDTYAYTSNQLTRLNEYVGALTADTYAYTSNQLTEITGGLISFTKASYAYTANAVTRISAYTATLTAASYVYTAKALNRSGVVARTLISSITKVLTRPLKRILYIQDQDE